MNADLEKPQGQDASISEAQRLAFFKQLQEVSNSIHATANIDEIMLDVSRDICRLCGSARLTLYSVNDAKNSIVSKVRIGMNSFKDFKLPINENSIAGYVALSKRLLNIHDVYDEAELLAHSRDLRFQAKVDQRTGYRTRQIVAAPIVKASNGELLGVLQLINNVRGGPFSPLIEEGVRELCKTLAIAFEQRLTQPAVIRTKFDPLSGLGFLSKAELVLATRAARRKGLDMEEVLIEEFQVKPDALGYAYSRFFEVPYEPFRPDRPRAPLMENFKRDYVEHNGWLVLEESGDALTILALDPEDLAGSRMVRNLFPKADISYRVTTHREFRQTVDQLFGAGKQASPDPSQLLLDRVNRIIRVAFINQAPEIDIDLQTVEAPAAAKDSDGAAQGLEGKILIHFRADTSAG